MWTLKMQSCDPDIPSVHTELCFRHHAWSE